jgi:FAD/FMN-containing dehydrogenase
MKNKRYKSWGGYPKTTHDVHILNWRSDRISSNSIQNKSFLPYGNGRSYGDVCLNDGGILLDCINLDHFINFDPQTGLIRCESGVTFSSILKMVVPKGWFLPVTPGTQFVTVGGAIANDVHGKNHHKSGTFGQHLLRFELLRSDGSRHICSKNENTGLFKATIGGLGLTGVITWAEFKLTPVKNALIAQEMIRFSNLNDFFELARNSDQNYEHTVAWIDCLATGKKTGRGIFIRGNHADHTNINIPNTPGIKLNFPFEPPFTLINSLSLKAFNFLYYHKQRKDRINSLIHYQPFFYPLDAIYNWNRIYGSKGFFQYQCVVPTDNMQDAMGEILKRIGSAGLGSFLCVLKLFGHKESPGLLSFPMPGATLALDFSNNGDKTLNLFSQLDEVIRSAGGRINPSKDSRMSSEDFLTSYPNWTKMDAYIDPCISSTFWRRVTALAS